MSIHNQTRSRLRWTISYKSLNFVHQSLELLPLFKGMRKRSFVGVNIRLQLNARTCFTPGLFSKYFFWNHPTPTYKVKWKEPNRWEKLFWNHLESELIKSSYLSQQHQSFGTFPCVIICGSFTVMKCKAIELTSLNSGNCIVKLGLFIKYQVQWSKYFKHWRLMVNHCWVNIFNNS